MSYFKQMVVESVGEILLTKMHYDEMSAIRVTMFIEGECVESMIMLTGENHLTEVEERFNNLNKDEINDVCIDLRDAYYMKDKQEMSEGITMDTDFYGSDDTPPQVH